MLVALTTVLPVHRVLSVSPASLVTTLIQHGQQLNACTSLLGVPTVLFSTQLPVIFAFMVIILTQLVLAKPALSTLQTA